MRRNTVQVEDGFLYGHKLLREARDKRWLGKEARRPSPASIFWHVIKRIVIINPVAASMRATAVGVVGIGWHDRGWRGLNNMAVERTRRRSGRRDSKAWWQVDG
jgi:hypothetical protein